MTEIIIDKYDAVLTIGTVASKLKVSVQTIRLYEQEGLILPVKTKGGRRMYSLHDLDRLVCIREMITKHGLNLNGIRQLMSMIPCWEYKGGLDEECQNCPVYYEAKGPCWTRGDVGPKCQEVNCRDCPVYRIELNCNKLKEVVFGHIAPKDEK
jgi:MerR family transcriptional regulator/heat shock protein HspR